jgi:F420-non-reducing hydrogenase iron-sulfur subunit
MAQNKPVITLVCERAADLNSLLDSKGNLAEMPDVHVVKFPCSGMIQPLMIEAALKAGAGGVIVCGCQIGDCYYREGNKMIRDRLLGERPPGLKKATDRRRVMALWLSRMQKQRFIAESKEFIYRVQALDIQEGISAGNKAAANPTPAAKPAVAVPAAATKPAPTTGVTTPASEAPSSTPATEPDKTSST